jgi:hypothetical protein
LSNFGLLGQAPRGTQKYAEAIENYKEALRWADKGERCADLNRKLAESYVAWRRAYDVAWAKKRAPYEAPRIPETPYSEHYCYGVAYVYMTIAAENAADNNKKAMYYLQAANYRSISATSAASPWSWLQNEQAPSNICESLSNAFRYSEDEKLRDKIMEARRKANCKF